MKHKIIAGCLAANLLFGTNVLAASPAAAFTDIKGSFAEEAIIHLTEQGIISGITPEKFAPEEKISRKHFAVLLTKVLGIQPVFPSQPTFEDLPREAPEFGYVEALVKLGLLKGTQSNYLGADDPVSRQDAAVLLHRVLGLETASANSGEKYLDEELISPYALDSVTYVTRQGWMKGYKGFFRPFEKLTRAETAVLVNRLYDLRKEQTPNAVLPLQELVVKVGETVQLELPPAAGPFPYTPVYGLDNPAIGTIYPNGAFTAGQQPETGTITVNAGYTSYIIKVSIISNDQALGKHQEE
ncbi:S-layer homology domain-containing protein [Desulfolucanica intricata]|uniref:S-layer homology domain-containing protein n=1 Tax=Desulfolucanica intricata TaxID=1285191 RepID=UPI000833EA30|nr:S-layer homology domain-containing protein [Desulfolucanica intricata]